MTITLSDKLSATIHELCEMWNYATPEDLITDALKALADKENGKLDNDTLIAMRSVLDKDIQRGRQDVKDGKITLANKEFFEKQRDKIFKD